MSTPRICLRFAMALALLLFGMPLGAIDAPVTPDGQAGDAAGPIWFSSGVEAPAAPESGGSRKPPEYSAVAAPGGAASAAMSRSGHAAVCEPAALSACPPRHLIHCVFLC